MINLYEYDDYRQYLRDYFDYMKQHVTSFSIRNFARQAGIASNSYCSKVVQGSRNLGSEGIEKFISGLKLSEREEHYFRALVLYNQEQDPLKKDSYYEDLLSYKQEIPMCQLKQSQYKYFSKWYYPVIRHLAVFSKWENDYKTLAQMVHPPISAEEAKTAIEDLLESELLVKKENNEFELNSTMISTDDIPVYYKRQGRREVLEKGIEAVDRLGPDKRFTSFYTLAIKEESYEKIITFFRSFENKMLEETARDDDAEKIYQVVFQAFPLSREIKK